MNDSVIGVNTVVTKDIKEKNVVVGIPAKSISEKGSGALVGSFLPWTNKFNQ